MDAGEGDSPGAHLLLRPNIFSISCSFSEILAKSYVGIPTPRGGTDFYEESWIRPCLPICVRSLVVNTSDYHQVKLMEILNLIKE